MSVTAKTTSIFAALPLNFRVVVPLGVYEPHYVDGDGEVEEEDDIDDEHHPVGEGEVTGRRQAAEQAEVERGRRHEGGDGEADALTEVLWRHEECSDDDRYRQNIRARGLRLGQRYREDGHPQEHEVTRES